MRAQACICTAIRGCKHVQILVHTYTHARAQIHKGEALGLWLPSSCAVCHFLRFCPYAPRARELQISSWFPWPFLTFPIYAFRKVIIWKKSVDMLNTLRHFSCQAISSCHTILCAQRYSCDTIGTMHQFPQVNAKKDELTGTHVKQWTIPAEPKHKW